MTVKTIPVGLLATNCYAAYNDGSSECVLVDPGDDAERIIGKLKEYGVKPSAILITHGHFDHIWAVHEIVSEYGNVKIYAGRNENALLNDPELNCTARCHMPMTVQPDKLLDNNEEFEAAGIGFVTMFTPGHTAGSVCYYVPERDVLFSGDTLFCNGMGRTDLPTGDESSIFRSLGVLKLLPDETKVYPGHAGDTTIGAEKASNPYLRQC